MIKALIRTFLMAAAVVVAAQFVPIIAEHLVALLILVLVIGLVGVITRVLLAALVVVAVLVWFHPLF
jgi:hypothetical protein